MNEPSTPNRKLSSTRYSTPKPNARCFADSPDWIVESELDLRVGGRWTLEFGPSRSELYREVAVFSEVDRPRRLAYAVTATFKDGRTLDTEMDITFEVENGTTRMTLVQSGYPSASIRDDFRGGWSSVLDALERVVAERAAAGSA